MLTDAQCKNAICTPGKTRTRFTDSGNLYLEVTPKGAKRWFWKYRKGESETRLALGSYPAVSLVAARRARDAARLQKADGVDPVQSKKLKRFMGTAFAGQKFADVANEWFEKQSPLWSDSHLVRVKRQLERDLFPVLGDRNISEIKPREVLAALHYVEKRGAFETAERCLQVVGQVLRYAVATDRAERDFTNDLRGALTPYRSKHFAAITKPDEMGKLIRAIRGYKGTRVVQVALQLAPMLFQRPGELRGARWDEIDFEHSLWTIPSARMKRTKDGKQYGDPHLVPLPRQAIELLNDLYPFTKSTGLVFPGERQRDKPISENSVRTALIAMGYTSEIQTWHGFRASARTMLAEQAELNFEPWLIEAQLAHSVRDSNGRSYNRTEFVQQRTLMMQRWADYLDEIAKIR